MTLFPQGQLETDEAEEFRSSSLKQIRLDSLKEGEKVHETSDNKAVFDVLRELYKLLVTRHLVSVQEWISILVRVEQEDIRFRDSTLKEFINIRNHLRSLKKKCEQLGCTLPTAINHEEEDLWEEGKIETFEQGNSSDNLNESLASASTVNEKKHENTSNGSGTLDYEEDMLRKKLLDEAPVMSWGSFLDSWGSNRDVLANQRGLELENHWGRVDYDAVIPAEKISELNVQATLYKEKEVEIRKCLAPLRSGGLCQRRDLRICPFHGPIIPRNAEGNPIDIINSSTFDKTVEKLAEQAVKNVRNREKEEGRRRENDKKTLKRAKLAKVREHNDALLRDAAMASTSRGGVVEDVEEVVVSKEKKPTLASMLRKKETAKDRLAERLLNARARDESERQLTLGEDANYREAFPNQW